MLLICKEVYILFLNYIQNSTSSPYKSVLYMFSWPYYQPDKIIILNTNYIITLNCKVLNKYQTKFFKDLIRYYLQYIIRPDEAAKPIEDFIFEKNWYTIMDYAQNIS